MSDFFFSMSEFECIYEWMHNNYGESENIHQMKMLNENTHDVPH